MARPDREPPERAWRKEMRCAICERCYENPEWPGRCIYGGPYAGFVDANTGRRLP